jgi:hypothetical protein
MVSDGNFSVNVLALRCDDAVNDVPSRCTDTCSARPIEVAVSLRMIRPNVDGVDVCEEFEVLSLGVGAT